MLNLKICHLYPDTLNLYGDSGNILCLKKRMEWRGLSAEVTGVPLGERFNPNDFDLFFIGGGQDFEQSVLLRDLEHGKKQDIINAVEDEKVFLAICGGYQLLGTHYTNWQGKQLDFIGAIDVHTIGREERKVGDFIFKLDDIDGGHEVIGFENHSGQTYLGEKVRPFGTIILGHGNNDEDKTEGARYKNVFATYSHGPLLPKNPKLCDHILKTALHRKHPNISLEEIDDTFENAAYDYMKARLIK